MEILATEVIQQLNNAYNDGRRDGYNQAKKEMDAALRAAREEGVRAGLKWAYECDVDFRVLSSDRFLRLYGASTIREAIEKLDIASLLSTIENSGDTE